ncbi:hypothetical protein [Nostoc sp. C110]|uniref:WD40 domain-containing protein n=1 Tax=Nostoc sp. C110 TaxID=3349876 RepID=UPI00370D4324
MSDSYQPEDVVVYNQRSLKKLIRSITNSQGHFALILARCNYCSLRDQMVQQIKEECQVEIRELHLSKSIKTLYTTIEANLGNQLPQALMIFDLELVDAIDQVLISTNQVREEFRKNFQFPIVIWVNDEIFQKLIQLMPDFKSWTGNSIKFKIAPNQLINNLHQIVNSLFAAIINVGAGKFIDNASLNLDLGILHLSEIKSAVRTLQISTEQLDPELNASLQFMLGREADASGHKSEAKDYYEQSLAIWEKKVKNQTNVSSDDLKRYGCLLWHLGLWWRQYATLHRSEYYEACLKAKDYFQKSVEEFRQHNYPDLAAKFINGWGEVLTRLEAWDELEKVALVAIDLHKTYPEPIRLGYSYGFIAEVLLKKSQWVKAQEYAELALQTNANVSSSETINWEWERKLYKNLYLLLLAEAQQNLNQVREAIANLETARSESNPQHDPLLYIRILARLRSLSYEQGNYLEAFQVKLEQRSIEQQYGLRAFVGAGRLQSKLQVINPALAVTAALASVTQEIAASGRMQDVNRLIERISRNDHKLTVIYGQSGVGKSSLVQAGLLPALKQRAIDARDVVPVLLQVYTDWTKVLGSRLVESLEEVRGLSFPLFLDSMAGFVEELNKNIEKGLLTVLIFDQFEEFFFAYKDQDKRRPFFEFIRDCLNIPYVKVILSLREDYLHYLLECNRLTHLEAIENNILDKKILYYLGNFSPEDARSVIQSLTESSQFYLEPPLIDELVQDLARDLNEIRPIELQVVGAQLQTEKITTLAQYQEQGPKERLVGRFLEEVVNDCGNNNEQFAKLVLYLLTDENNTRPLKTRAELEADLALEPTRLDLILKILVKSGLVFQVPGFPADRYQLVHDYLVPFVREQQSARLIAELEKEKEQRKLTEARLNQVLTQQLKTARRQTFILAGLLAAISGIAAAIVFVINTSLTALSGSSENNTELDRLVSALKAGKELKKLSIGTIPGTRLKVISELSKAIQGITEINRIEGHDKTITALSFSSDSKMLVTGTEDGMVKVWSIPEGKEIKTIKAHNGSVTSFSFSPDGKMLATASKDKTVKIWSFPDGREINTLKGHKGSVSFVSFSPNSKLLATASEDKTVKIWSLDGKAIRNLSGLSDKGVVIRFSPNNKVVAIGGLYDTVKLLDIEGKQNRNIGEYGVINIKFSENGQTINLLNKNKKLSLWSTLNTQLLIKSNQGCRDYGGKVLGISDDAKSFMISDSGRSLYLLLRDQNDCTRVSEGLEHNDIVTYASLSPDKRLLASVSQNKVVKLWNINYKISSFAENSREQITNIRFSFDGKVAAIGRNNNTISLQNREGKTINTIQGDSSVLSFSPDNQTLATGSSDDILKIWKLDSKQEIILKGHSNSTTSIDISPNNQLIASASTDNSVRLWRSNGDFIRTLPGKNQRITSISFSPNSQIIASISDENEVQLWNSRDGSLIKTLLGHTESITSVLFSPNSQILATIGDDNLIKLYKYDGTPIDTLTGHLSQVTSIEFSQDSSKLLSVSLESGEIKLWRTSDSQLLKSIDNLGTKSASFSPDGSFITSINIGNTVKLWSLEGDSLATFKGDNDEITDVSFSPDGAMIATSRADNIINLWNRKGKKLRTLRGHSKGVNDVSFSPNGKFIASASSDNSVIIWRTSDGQPIRIIPGFSNGVDEDIGIYNISFSSNGQIISGFSRLANGKNLVTLWSLDGKVIKTIQSHTNIGFSQNWKTVVLVSKENTLKLWSLDGKLIATLQGHSDQINSVTFSPVDNIIASASDDKTIKLWNRNGKLLKTISEHKDKVNSISFSPNGKTIASASDDKTIKLWNLDGSLIQNINESTDKVSNVHFRPDGKAIATVSGSSINLWNLDGKLIKSLKDDSGDSGSLSFSEDSKILASGAKLHLLDGIWHKETFLSSISSFSGERFNFNASKAIALDSNEGRIYLNSDLDDLLARACSWASDYLKNNPKMKDDRHLCDDINTQ